MMASSLELKDVPSMNITEFCEFLGSKFDLDVVAVFEKNKISGSLFMLMSEEQIKSQVSAIGDHIMLQQLQTAYRQPAVANDPSTLGPSTPSTPCSSKVCVCFCYFYRNHINASPCNFLGGRERKHVSQHL